jgi:transcriptional regulator with XRE-family HTH domain
MPRPRLWNPNDRLVFERERRGWSQDDAAREAEQVADRLGLRGVIFTGQQFGRWERGECRPRPPNLGVVCELYEASAEILGLCDSPPAGRSTPSTDAARAVLLQPAPLAATGYAGEGVSSPLGTPHAAEPLAQDQEVKATNRREAIGHAIALGTGLLVGERMLGDAADASVAASRKLSASRVDPMTLEELDQDVERFARDVQRIPHLELFPQVWADWLQVDRLLDGRQRLKDRSHLTLLAGQLTYFLGRLSFNMGDYAAARKHAVHAWEYADDIEQAVLCTSVKALHCSIASYSQQHHKALRIVQSAEPYLTSYSASRMAAYEARARAMLGDRSGVEAALARVERQLVDMPVQPGSSPFTMATAMMFLAGTHARLGNGETAEGYARQAIALYDAPAMRASSFEDRAHAKLHLAASLVLRPRPEPEEAARLGAEVLGVPAAQRTDTAKKRAVELWGLLADWPTIAAVQDFGDRLRSYRPAALPAPGT